MQNTFTDSQPISSCGKDFLQVKAWENCIEIQPIASLCWATRVWFSESRKGEIYFLLHCLSFSSKTKQKQTKDQSLQNIGKLSHFDVCDVFLDSQKSDLQLPFNATFAG